jgi:DNA polymerase III epsilon subunit-like protein
MIDVSKLDLVFIDWETTGLVKPEASDLALQPHGIEFYGIRVTHDFQVVSEFETLMKPPVVIPEFIEKYIHITNDMVKDSPAFVEVYSDLVELFMGAGSMVAHNCSFDRDILKFELRRIDREINFPWPPNHVCTVEKSFAIKNRRLKLAELHQLATGKPFDEGAHRAKNDVMALIRSYQGLQKQGLV